MSSLREIVDRYEGEARRLHTHYDRCIDRFESCVYCAGQRSLISRARAELLHAYPHMCRNDHIEVGFREGASECEELSCPVCFERSQPRAELERRVDVRKVLEGFGVHLYTGEDVERMARALRDAGVRVVEDGKESSDG